MQKHVATTRDRQLFTLDDEGTLSIETISLGSPILTGVKEDELSFLLAAKPDYLRVADGSPHLDKRFDIIYNSALKTVTPRVTGTYVRKPNDVSPELSDAVIDEMGRLESLLSHRRLLQHVPRHFEEQSSALEEYALLASIMAFAHRYLQRARSAVYSLLF